MFSLFYFCHQGTKIFKIDILAKIFYVEHKNPSMGHAWYRLAQDKDGRQKATNLSPP
jgi:hypothetical protein